VPAHLKSPSARKGHHSTRAGRALVPEPLPQGLSRARAATRELWESFFTSGLWGAWSDTQRAIARDVVRMHDAADRAAPAHALKLQKEMRLAMRGLRADESAPRSERADHTRGREERRREVEALFAGMGPADRARAELAALS
jgi:hypothetical protein